METRRRIDAGPVVLAGYYGFGNLGDELLAEAAIGALLRCGLQRENIVMLSNDPVGSRKNFGVNAVNRWKAGEVFRALRQSGTLLLGGGGLFQDATSLRSCLYYWGLVRMAAFCGAAPWAMGQSVGPLSTGAGRWLTRDALRRCRAVQVRDEVSLSLCESLGLSVEMGHDLAFSLGDSVSDFISGPAASDSTSRLLVNLRPHPGGLPERLAEALSSIGNNTGNELSGGEVVGVALSEEDGRLMRRLVQEGRLFLSRVERPLTFADAAALFQGARAAVGMRLHFAVLAALTQVPLLAAPYDPKVEAFAARYEVPVWRAGRIGISAPRVPAVPEPDAVRGDLDAFCRRTLFTERIEEEN